MDERLMDEAIQVPVSAIEHYAYCPRQCALIHVEQSYADNVFTLRGRYSHQRAHAPADTTQGDAYAGVRTSVARALTIYSDRWGLIGQADIVEFRAEGPYPVEFKSGRVHRAPAELQLCAQALCLEEMYGQPVPQGAIYRAAGHNREEIALDAPLRERCHATIDAVRLLLEGEQVPAPVMAPQRCRGCSLRDVCQPDIVRDGSGIQGLQRALYSIGVVPGEVM